MLLPDWKDIRYLRAGSAAQQAAYAVLQRHRILAQLHAYDPVLVGTFPLDITVAGSDLDVACAVPDAAEFLRTAARCFAHHKAYRSRCLTLYDVACVVVNFRVEETEVELFGQPVATEVQAGYRHMVVEARLLRLGGPALKAEIIRRKRQGQKTEPAFAAQLGLSGDPYQAMLALADADEATLAGLLRKSG